MFGLIPEDILVSSVIVMPTERFLALGEELQHINNLPAFIDITDSVDPQRHQRERKFPQLTFVHIKEPHDGTVYDGNNDNDIVDLGEVIAPFIEKGTSFKIQRMTFHYNGVDYYSWNYNEHGAVSDTKDLTEELPDLYHPDVNL